MNSLNPNSLAAAGTFRLGDRIVNRLGYGAMQLAGPGVFGPPKDRATCIEVLRTAIAAGVNHVDTSDFYGPYVTNEIIVEALHPYPANLTIVTKVGARRGDDASWIPAASPTELIQQVHDNRRHLQVDALDVVNMRVIGDIHAPSDSPIAPQIGALADLQRQGFIRHLGLSNVTATQLREARAIAPIVCVQNQYNLVYRADEALLEETAKQDIAFVPFFPLGGFTPLQSAELSRVATELGATPMQVALAWLLQRSPNLLLIPGTSSLAHLRENLAAAALQLPTDVLNRLNAIGSMNPAAAGH